MDNLEIAHKNLLLWKLLHPRWFNRGRAKLVSNGNWKVQLSRDDGKSFYQIQALDANGKGNWKKSLMLSKWDFKYKLFYIEPYGDSIEELCWKADLFDWLLSLEYGFRWVTAELLSLPQERESRIIELDLNFTATDRELENSLVEMLEWYDSYMK